MEIEYKQTKDFTADELQKLFLSVHWESGNYPEKLVRAMHNSTRVISAWDGDKLVGLVRALDDGETVAFLHYLLVDPAYQGQYIGDELMKRIMSFYQNLLYVKVNFHIQKILKRSHFMSDMAFNNMIITLQWCGSTFCEFV